MYNKVFQWIDSILNTDISDEVAAFCFNLYEEAQDDYAMELIGASVFSPDDSDWACEEVSDFGSREDMFCWQKCGGWEAALGEISSILRQYLEDGKYADKLKSKAAVAVGFVDGDLELLHT